MLRECSMFLAVSFYVFLAGSLIVAEEEQDAVRLRYGETKEPLSYIHLLRGGEGEESFKNQMSESVQVMLETREPMENQGKAAPNVRVTKTLLTSGLTTLEGDE